MVQKLGLSGVVHHPMRHSSLGLGIWGKPINCDQTINPFNNRVVVKHNFRFPHDSLQVACLISTTVGAGTCPRSEAMKRLICAVLIEVRLSRFGVELDPPKTKWVAHLMSLVACQESLAWLLTGGVSRWDEGKR